MCKINNIQFPIQHGTVLESKEKCIKMCLVLQKEIDFYVHELFAPHLIWEGMCVCGRTVTC